MKGIILYSSKYGATKRYAEWLAEETGFDCIETERARIEQVKRYDTILLGGGVYASGIAGLSFLKKNIAQLHRKKIIVFCDGASPYEEKTFRQIVAYNMKGPLSGFPCFYCRGALDFDHLDIIDKSIYRILQEDALHKKPEEYDAWEKAMMDAGSDKQDWTDRSYIAPILKELKS